MKKTSSCVATIVTTLLLGALALIVPAPAQAATPVPGSDCGCATATGAYKLPQAPKTPYVGSDGSSAASGAKYRVETQGAWPDVTVQIRRLSDSKIVLTANGVPANWGFSPDQDRFVTYGLLNGTYYVQAYDLTATNPSTGMWSTSTLSSENRIGFSPHGKYVVFTWLNNASNTVTHQLVDVATAREYDVQYSFYTGPGGGGDEFGSTGFGFSPDANDRGLFTTYVTGQSTVQDALYDLSARAQTWSHQRIGSGFVKFGPCGDVLGVVEQNGQIDEIVTLVKVSDGTVIGSARPPIATIDFRATSTEHQVLVNGVASRLAANTAGALCVDTTKPTWPANATLTASNVTKTSLTLTWPAASDDKAVTTYKVFKGSTQLGTTGATNRTFNVTGLTQGTSYTFTVQAADAAGNTTTDGPSLTVRTAADAPAWPAGSSVVAGNVTEEGATLRWSGATGTVSSYKVYRDGVSVGTLPGTARSYAASGLASGTSYVFKIEAVGPTGAESANGPAVRVRTPGFVQLDTDSITGTVWWDDDTDGERDENEDGVDGTPSGGYADVGLDLYRIVDGTAAQDGTGAHMATDGTYGFENLPDGDYLVVLDIGRFGQTFPGDNQPQRITVAGGQGVGNVDFGMKFTSTIPQQGTGSGTITATVTADGGGTVDGAGVDCYYATLGSGCGDDPTAGENGTLTMSGLTSGTYELSADLGPHQWLTAPVLNDEPLKHVIVVGSNGGSGAASFTVLQGRSTITGEVYDDANGDGVRGSGEGPLTAPDSVDICLESVDGVEQECTSTDGTYSFTNLRGGDYRISVYGDGDWDQTEPAEGGVLVHVAENGDTVEAGLIGAHNPRGTVHGVVWDDKDADGKHDADEPALPGISVCTQKAGVDGWDCRDTDAEGRYATGLLRVADYVVWIENGAIDEWIQTFPADSLGHEVTVTDGGEHVADFGLNDGTVVEEDTAPGAPTSLEAVAGVETVSLSWAVPADDGGSPVTGYVVQQSIDGVVWGDVASVEGTSTEVTGLAGGIPVHFRVAAVNAVGQGDWSDVVSATPEAPVRAPSTPNALHAVAGIEKVTLDWSAPESDGGSPVTGYVVEQSLDGTSWTEAGVPSGTTLEVTGLAAGVPVQFRVAAVNVAGRSGFAEATATPLAKPKPPVVTVPSAPTGLSAAVSKNRRTVVLTWQAPASNGNAPITDYVVQRTLFPALGWVTVTDGVSPSTSATITSPLPGIRFAYRVAARNSAGQGAWSTVLYAG